MKKLFIAFVAILLAAPAYADGRHGGGWGRGGGWERGGDWGWRNDWIVPALIGGAILYDLSQPRVYVQQPAPVYAPNYAPVVAPAPVQQYWYYCPPANAYYPYVPSCPSGWQAVPATPPDNLPSAPYAAPEPER
jgi:hypothetical protein